MLPVGETCQNTDMAEPMSAEQMRAEFARREAGYAYLEAERAERIRNADTAVAMRQLSGLVLPYVAENPPPPTSGLIEWYRLLAKMPR